jgi:hypothetical protein
MIYSPYIFQRDDLKFSTFYSWITEILSRYFDCRRNEVDHISCVDCFLCTTVGLSIINYLWSHSAATVAVPVFVVAETTTSGVSCLFGFPTRPSSAFQTKSDGIFCKWIASASK